MPRSIVVIALLAVCGSAGAFAQVGDRDSGSVPMGSKGFEWQTEQALAKEKAAEFRAHIERLAEDEWLETALATLRFDRSDGGLVLDEAFRIGDVAVDRKAVTEPGEYSRSDDPSWVVTFGKKAPRVLTLTLTDTASTEVRCAIEELLAVEDGTLGVFQSDTELLCFAR